MRCLQHRDTSHTSLDLFVQQPSHTFNMCERLRRALQQGLVNVLYKPIVRMANGKVSCAEALITYNDGKGRDVPVDLYELSLQEADLSQEVTLFAFSRVIKDLEKCLQQGFPPIPVAVPVTARVLERFDFFDKLVARLHAHNIYQDFIRIQIANLPDPAHAYNIKACVDKLRENGFLVYLDSSASYFAMDIFRHLSFDAIKLDVSFLQYDDDPNSVQLLETTLQTAKNLGYQTIAVGVENPVQVEVLKSMGYHYLQGDFFGQPKSAEEIIATNQSVARFEREPWHERKYWNIISSINLHDVQWSIDKQVHGEIPVFIFPVAVIEKRGSMWRLLRSIETYARFLQDANLVVGEREGLLEPTYFDSLFTCDASDTWKHICGHLEHGTKYQFYVRQIAIASGAVAYVVGAIPTMLGTALGSYGDVPVAYAVIHAILSEEESDVIDAEYVYINDLHCEWIHLEAREIIGRRLTSIYKDAKQQWIPLCRRAAACGEDVHSVFYNEEIGHWLSLHIAPSLVEDHYIYAISFSDDEQREHEAMERHARRLEDISMHDSLTGVLNRRGIDISIDKRLAVGDVERYALILMDIDDFKTINDVHGHDVGDEALRVISHTLVSLFPDNAILGRNGGDEFLVMLVNDYVDLLPETLERLVTTKLWVELHGARHKVSMSIGYVTYPDQVGDLKSAYTKADAALYAVKLSGKSNYGRYRPQLETQYRSQLGFTPRDIAENVPGSILVHEPGADGRILFANDELVALFECDDLSDFMDYTGGVFSGVIYPGDHEAVKQTLLRQITLEDVGGKNFVNFRIVTKGGKIKNVANNGRLVEIAEIGKVFYELIIDLDERAEFV